MAELEDEEFEKLLLEKQHREMISSLRLMVTALEKVGSSDNDAGTMGNKMNSAASAGDPWSTLLPGSYGDGEAGKILAQIQTLVDELHKIQGLKSGDPMTIDIPNETRSADGIVLSVESPSPGVTVVTRQP